MTGLALLWNNFWFSEVTVVPLQRVRKAVAGLAVLTALTLWPDIEPFFGNTWLTRSGAEITITALFFSAVLVCIGRFASIATVVMAGSLIILAKVNPFIFNSGDVLLRHLAVILAFSPLALSRSGCHLWPLRLVQLQIAIMYVAAVFHKLGGNSWREGSAAMYPLRIADVSRYQLPASLIDHQFVANFLTWGTLTFEAAFPLLVWNRRLRPWVLGMGVLFHLGIDITLRAGLFSWVVIAAYLSFFTGEIRSKTIRDGE